MQYSIRFPKDRYHLLHEGLRLLANKIDDQIKRAAQLGIDHLELDEKRVIVSGMIDYAEEHFYQKNLPFVLIEGVSAGSLSLLKTGAIENLKYLDQQKNLVKEKGLKEGIDRKTKEIESILNLEMFKDVGLDKLFEEETSVIRPIVFISYAAEELALADFVRSVLRRLVNGRADIFVAKRDIPSGDDPLRVMLEEKLKNAKAIIPICSLKSKASSWVWWESSAVWAKGNKVYPLFTNINPAGFGPPLTLVSQGKDYFIEEEFIETLKKACLDLGIAGENINLISNEAEEIKKLKVEYSTAETSAKIEVNYIKIMTTSALHKYSFLMDVENETRKKFDDIVVELIFPESYLERKNFSSPHLKSTDSFDNPGYKNIMFTYSALEDNFKREFGGGLLPGKKFHIFGDEGVAKLVYEMDRSRWQKRFEFNIQWKVYINGGAPIEGMIPLNKIQDF